MQINYLASLDPSDHSGSPFYLGEALRSCASEGGQAFRWHDYPVARRQRTRASLWGMTAFSHPRLYNISQVAADLALKHVNLVDSDIWVSPFQIVPRKIMRSRSAIVAQVLDCTLSYLFDNYDTARPLSPWTRRALISAERASYERANRIFVYHSGITDELIERYGINPDKILVVGRGVNIVSRSITPRSSSPRELTRHLIFVGRDAKRKGLDTLIGALDRLHGQKGNAFDLTVIGPDVEDVPNRPYIRPLGYLGADRREEVLQLISESDLCVLLSRAEGLPGFLWEAAYFGRETLVLDLPQYRELPSSVRTVRVPMPGSIDDVSKSLDSWLARSRPPPYEPSAHAHSALSWTAVASAIMGSLAQGQGGATHATHAA